ncbi:hypothetical protein EST38_g14081 [Candolleomyces aberdarensis]|uniref:Nephrocystin 3-like N-terminal domain-containing protein n=1 Tax=Candolleomyces aberdarensis TaxID=2316362 RepID=A0A4Q2D0M4_9AGAR|nr:hypothetical protein EST38_g14081 [Candolleomyces aberdarensis]
MSTGDAIVVLYTSFLPYRPPSPPSTSLRECSTLQTSRSLYSNANIGDNFGIINQGAGSIDTSAHWYNAQIGQQTNNIAGDQYILYVQDDLIRRLNPILDASHTRNRKRSPPDSECFPGTREEPIQEIIIWGNSGETLAAAIPATAPLIEAAVRGESGLVTGDTSLATQLDLLILSPFKDVIDQGVLGETLAKGPFLIVIDGLDECEDKQGVEEFIDHMLAFFAKYQNIPLRIFIASRVEKHIRERLETNGVHLGNLDTHSSHKDIEKWLHASFQTVAKRDRVIQAYVRERGSWPTKPDMGKLIKHTNGSFVLASTMFNYIVQPPTQEDPTTPMERLPLTLEMNGLDGLYAQTLARSEHFPHFSNIISTITLLMEPLPIVGIAEILGIKVFEVNHVLMNLQAIIHVPGTDQEGEVTLGHTSLRDFLTTENRSKAFFVPPSFHLYLSYYCFALSIERRRSNEYARQQFHAHWLSFAESETCNLIDEIERLKARQPPFFDRLPYQGFLCSMLFHFFLLAYNLPELNDRLYLLMECTKQLELAAAESSNPHTQRWFKEDLPYVHRWGAHTFRFTESTFKTLQRHLEQAYTGIHANTPALLLCGERGLT